MIKQTAVKCCEHCGSPEEKQCYIVTSFPETIIPSMTLCEDCLKKLGEEITQALSSTGTTE